MAGDPGEQGAPALAATQPASRQPASSRRALLGLYAPPAAASRAPAGKPARPPRSRPLKLPPHGAAPQQQLRRPPAARPRTHAPPSPKPPARPPARPQVAVKLLLNCDVEANLHDMEDMKRAARRALSLSNPVLRNLQARAPAFRGLCPLGFTARFAAQERRTQTEAGGWAGAWRQTESAWHRGAKAHALRSMRGAGRCAVVGWDGAAGSRKQNLRGWQRQQTGMRQNEVPDWGSPGAPRAQEEAGLMAALRFPNIVVSFQAGPWQRAPLPPVSTPAQTAAPWAAALAARPATNGAQPFCAAPLALLCRASWAFAPCRPASSLTVSASSSE